MSKSNAQEQSEIEYMQKHEFNFSRKNFLFIQKLVRERCGISLDNERSNAVYNRLVKRLRDLQFKDFDVYCQWVLQNIEEENKLINLISNTSTYFFRENHHFEFLAQLLPQWLAEKNKIRIWSAGCATGEEPYSVAIVIQEVITNMSKYDIKILATDINTDALTIARKGIYPFNSIKKISKQRQRQWFKEIKDKDIYKIDESLQDIITFRKLNLMSIWPMRSHFDVIFCRNVTIYFKKEMVLKLLDRFNKMLNIGGILIIGYSEHLYHLNKNYKAIGKSIYQKMH